MRNSIYNYLIMLAALAVSMAHATNPSYFSKYSNLKLERQSGILTATMHTNGGSIVFGAKPHEELVDAFYDISRDRANRVVILTGAGADWMSQIDFPSFGDITQASQWAKVVDEGTQILENIANIKAPMICAVNGKAWIHTEYCLLSNYVLAADNATFMDLPHFGGNIVPGDGIFTTWSYVAGPNRAQGFLLLPRAIDAKTAQAWGVVNEIVPARKLQARAQEIAKEWSKKSDLTLRYTRVHFIQPLKERLIRETALGLTLEGESAKDSFGKKN